MNQVSPKAAITDYKKDFREVIGKFRYSHGIRELFTDWLTLAACTVHQKPYHEFYLHQDSAFQQVETQYLSVAKKYQSDELDAFANLLAISICALQQCKTDFLGQVYMELGISQDRSGEYFTPFDVSYMMAQIIIGDPSLTIHEKGFITVAEPACGAGGMIIAAARVIEEAGHEPYNVMYFDATDISKTCFHMTYIQTSLLSLFGVVRHGDTLRAEQWDAWLTPICRVFPQRTRNFTESLLSTPEESARNSFSSPPLAHQFTFDLTKA